MKKLLTLALMLALVISLVSCSVLPEDLAAKLEGIKDSVLGGGEHTHAFVVTDSKEATCLEDGYTKSACECGEKQEEVIPATGHDMVRTTGSKDPTCVEAGRLKTKCSVCGKTETQILPATGHNFVSGEASRGKRCTNGKCPYFVLPKYTDGKYADDMVFTFGDADKATLEAKHEQMLALLQSAEAYDAAKHAYAEEGVLAEAYAAAEAVMDEYYDLIGAVGDQYVIARTLYYCDNENEELEATYNDMMEYYNALISKFYELSQPWYDSMYREFYYYGMTEEEINAFLFDSNAVANPEYKALKDRNDAIELELNGLSAEELMYGDKVPTLYAEFVENNKKLAALLGYDNYLEYAYENVYSREYSPEDVANFAEYVKTYLVPAFNMLYSEHSGAKVAESSREGILACIEDSFFDSPKANAILNDFIDEMEMGFTSNPDKLYSFSDVLNDLVVDGNLFRGSYEGAHVTSLSSKGIPLAYFGGADYNNIFTVAHEFGHYMNEIYNKSEYDQSYDLLEVHSQGHESLLLYYIEHSGIYGADVTDYVNRFQMLNNLYIIVAALQVDAFEQAIYLNYYDGYGSEEIMADGKITPDEYDTLYANLSIDFGVGEDYRNNTYWRNGMTITSPCYYVSYSVSAVNALQVYLKANNDGFDVAKESYLKLISYTDVDPDMDMNEVIEYAGFYSYMDEQLYKELSEYFANR